MGSTRLLVTGGAGFLGINLLRYCLPLGYALTSLDYAPFDYHDMRPHVTVWQGDIRDPLAVERAMEGVTHVVHAAAALPSYTPADIYSTDVDGTRLVFETARRHGVARVVLISSTAVYGIPDNTVHEDSYLEGIGPYGNAKIQAEMTALDYRARGLVVPILRPKTFIGPERLGVFDILFDWALDGRNFPVLGNGNNRYQFLHVHDLCRAIEMSLTLPGEQVNDTFNIGAMDYGTLRSDYQAVLDHAGFGKQVIPVPATPAIAALRVLEALHLSPIYRWVYETAVKDSEVTIQRVAERMGFRPRYSNRDALLDNFNWYHAHRAEFVARSDHSHRAPWKQGAIGIIKRAF